MNNKKITKPCFFIQTHKQCLLFQFVYCQQINTVQCTCYHDDGVVGIVPLLFVAFIFHFMKQRVEFKYKQNNEQQIYLINQKY